jgi:hypothetical protein
VWRNRVVSWYDHMHMRLASVSISPIDSAYVMQDEQWRQVIEKQSEDRKATMPEGPGMSLRDEEH